MTGTARKAVVLAAGFGTRLRPFTCAVPKPLLPVWGEPMLARVVGWLREQGVEDIVVNGHYRHGQVEAWCAANGCRASYEPEILGTGGVLNPLRDWIGGDDFWLVNGDIVFENCLISGFSDCLIDEQPRGADKDRALPGALGAMAPTKSNNPKSNNQTILGVCLATAEAGPRTIEVEPEGGLVTCWHSPDPGWNGTYTYCGVALLKADILNYVAPTGFSSIIEAYEKAAMDGRFIKAVTPEGLLWTDAGTVESYVALNQDGADNAFDAIPQVEAALAKTRLTGLEKIDGMGGTGHPVNQNENPVHSVRVDFLGVRGSDRAFFKAGEAYIIVYDDEKRGENAKYAGHARWLKAQGIKVPEVLADLPELKTLALASAGSEDLRDRSRRRGEDRLYDYVAVVEELAKFNGLISRLPDCLIEGDESDATQNQAIKQSNNQTISLEPPFDAALYKWERDLFREHCLEGRFRVEMPEAVERELEQVAARLEKEPPALVHRDFQSSNVIWKNDDFSIIDFQGMRRGPAAYDLASLLYDPYVDLREGERRALAALYAKKAGRADIADVLPFAAVERLVQALGAFGRLTAAGKAEFGAHILPALENLLAAADEAGLEAVGALAEDLIAKEQAAHRHHHHGGCGCGRHHHHGEGK